MKGDASCLCLLVLIHMVANTIALAVVRPKQRRLPVGGVGRVSGHTRVATQDEARA